MKKIILMSLVCVFALTASSVYNDAVGAVKSATIKEEAVKTPVKKEDLPEGIKTTLAGADYKDWEVTEAFSVKDETSEWYEVSLKSADKTTTVKFDKEGKKIA